MDLIIRIRLEVLKNNLNKMTSIVASVNSRRSEIDRLSADLVLAEEKLDFIGSCVTEVLDISRNTFAKKPIHQSLAGKLDKAKETALEFNKLLQEMQKNVGAIRNRWSAIDESLEEAFEASLKEDLEERIGDSAKKIDKNIAALADGSLTGKLLEEAWRDYGEITSEQSQLIFADYVEFLGGLALRYSGLDEGICRIADELMRGSGSFGSTFWSALTIPASQEAMTLARSIRMRFPEWTIWAVPLTAHEFGHVVISGNKRLQKCINTEYSGEDDAAVKGRQDMLVCLADAFATYVMGPAYACAVILLRLNPREAYEDRSKSPADAKRAHIVLKMLDEMGTMSRGVGNDENLTPPYRAIVDKLRKEWDAALTQAKAQAPKNWNKVLEQLDKWSKQFKDELFQSYRNGLYEGTLWTSTLATLEDLLEEKDPGDKLEGYEEWGDVLNAAWAHRVNNPENSQEIASTAEELWRRIEDKKRELRERAVYPTGVLRRYSPPVRGKKDVRPQLR